MIERGENDDVARALRLLGQSPEAEGIEARVLSRVRQRQAEISVAADRRRSRRVRWMYAGCAAAVAVAMALGHFHSAPAAVSPAVAAAPVPAAPVPAAPVPAAAGATAPSAAAFVAARRRAPQELGAGHGLRRVGLVRPLTEPVFLNAPPLPLTHQEYLLLALARTPKLAGARGLVTASETVPEHGLGSNAIFELEHEELKPLETTNPATMNSGDPQ